MDYNLVSKVNLKPEILVALEFSRLKKKLLKVMYLIYYLRNLAQ